jgi:hypothetical protein
MGIIPQGTREGSLSNHLAVHERVSSIAGHTNDTLWCGNSADRGDTTHLAGVEGSVAREWSRVLTKLINTAILKAESVSH